MEWPGNVWAASEFLRRVMITDWPGLEVCDDARKKDHP
jgi:hypothetical protein